MVRVTCPELLFNCTWNGKPFNCCDYFLPLQTSLGRCFILNSIQTTKRNGPHWLETETSWAIGFGRLQFEVSNPTQVHLLNAEDIPMLFLQSNVFKVGHRQREWEIQLSTQSMINDPDVREISPEFRKCRFPDENFGNSDYQYYSFSSCVSDCLKRLQNQTCGCVHHNYIVKSTEKIVICDYKGLICLDHADLLRPKPTILQPWRSNSIVCKCLPSCTEHEINVASDYFE
ncbi:pickpocket protein 19 [Episyrphus balteatus]|uniref:pickpocket protein 19 n=1 Tax=Episyrphus balteatus TaxID=286459 RepID=UPI00248609A9|nr:pickpocket protein 19 [Episyrphus balteatus]